jgi:hypothetical protein
MKEASSHIGVKDLNLVAVESHETAALRREPRPYGEFWPRYDRWTRALSPKGILVCVEVDFLEEHKCIQPGDGGDMFLRNVYVRLQHYAMLQIRRTTVSAVAAARTTN